MQNVTDVQLPSLRNRLLIALAYVSLGVLATGILAAGKSLIEHRSLGREYEYWVFGLLQGSLSSVDAENPVALIDITDVAENSEVLTETITNVVGALKTLDRRPVAIGVDVDFSPKSVLSDDAITLFDACLRQGTDDVPVFLAVGDNKSAPPRARLGLEKYENLAAAVAINKKDTRRLPIWVRANNQTEELNTLSYALALEYRRHLPGPPAWIAWAVDRSEEGKAETYERSEVEKDEIVLNYGERLVNYSKLESMKMAASKNNDAQSIKSNGKSYAGKVVIIGDVTDSEDFFPVPGRRDNEAGSLLLANSLYTLVKEPLFEFKSSVTLALDLLIAAIIIGSVAFIRFRNPIGRVWVGKQAVFIYAAVTAIGVTGFVLVRLAGVMWLDFMMVAFALVLHPKVEHGILRVVSKLGSRFRPPPKPESKEPAAVVAILILIATLGITANIEAQVPSDLCRQTVAAVALRLQRKPQKDRKKPTCQYRESEKDAWHDLSEADMMKRGFRAGQDVRCHNGCSLTILLCSTYEKRLVEHRGPIADPKWFRLINPFQIPRRIVDKNPGKPAKKIIWVSYMPGNPTGTSRARAVLAGKATGIGAVVGAIAGGGSGASVGAIVGGGEGANVGNLARTRNDPSSSGKATRNARAKTTGPSRQALEFKAQLAEGNRQYDAGEYSAAEKSYLRAVDSIPDNPDPYVGLGNVYAGQQKWGAAEASYSRALAFAPNSSKLYLGLAGLALAPGETDDRRSQAERYVWTAAQLDPLNPKVYELLYTLLEQRRASDVELEAAYRRVLALNPLQFETNLRLSTQLWKLGRKGEAGKYLLMAEKSALSVSSLLAVAEAFESQKHHKKAEKLAHRAISLDSTQSQAYVILGLALVDRARYLEALTPLGRAAQSLPDAFVPIYLLGIAQLRSGQLDAAEKSFKEAAKKVSDGTDELLATAYWLGELGDAYLAAGRPPDAVRLYEESLKYNSEDLRVQRKLLEHRGPKR